MLHAGFLFGLFFEPEDGDDMFQQNVTWLHPYSMGTRCPIPEGKVAEAWIWPLTYIYCQGQEWWSYTSTPPYVSIMVLN
jgi:hypothetical protein